MESLHLSPDLQQNIFYTVYFIFLHNFAAIFYLIGIVTSALMLILKPTRWKVLLLFGFIILLFGFQYNKHIIEPLTQQTLNSLITIRQHYKVYRIVNFVLAKALPILLPLTGWGLVLSGTIFATLKLDKRKHK